MLADTGVGLLLIDKGLLVENFTLPHGLKMLVVADGLLADGLAWGVSLTFVVAGDFVSPGVAGEHGDAEDADGVTGGVVRHEASWVEPGALRVADHFFLFCLFGLVFFFFSFSVFDFQKERTIAQTLLVTLN